MTGPPSSRWLLAALAGALILARLPSLVQPMGADQGLYAYVGQRMLAGDVPYRDAWDQKPPAIHFTYAAMRALWPSDAAVAAADLIAACGVGFVLLRLGTLLGGPPAGAASALLFLLLSNPSFTRLGGIRLRGQCETFIALAVTGACLMLFKRRAVAAGVLFGVAFIFKYNAAVYALAGVTMLWLKDRLGWADVARVAAGACIPGALILAYFAAAGSLGALYDATITYNVQYSGETYAGPSHALRYLVTFPIDRARVDALWTLGGAGCLVLLAGAAQRPALLVPVVWVSAACLSVALNGSRGLPQYFIQANPALALAAGWGGAIVWEFFHRVSRERATFLSALAALLVCVAVWRVNQFPKLVEQTAFDLRYALGHIPRADYLARYADERKYSARAADELAAFLREHSAESERVYVFGFTCAAYVDAGRASASRFFWSRPVIAGFLSDRPGYGPTGLLADLQQKRPAVVALQQKDWSPDVSDSADFFLGTPALAAWLESGYARATGPVGFDVWLRKDRAQ